MITSRFTESCSVAITSQRLECSGTAHDVEVAVGVMMCNILPHRTHIGDWKEMTCARSHSGVDTTVRGYGYKERLCYHRFLNMKRECNRASPHCSSSVKE